jgi:iron uptake system EfeUOB component EfeO/EfeM
MQENKLYEHITTKAIIKIIKIYKLADVSYVSYEKVTKNDRFYNKYEKPLYVINSMYRPI